MKVFYKKILLYSWLYHKCRLHKGSLCRGEGLEKGLSLDPCAISGTLVRCTGPSAGPSKIAKGYEERDPSSPA